MPKKDRIFCVADDSRGDESDSTILKTYVLVPKSGPKTLVKMTGNRHDPNGNGTGNFSEVLELEIIGSRKRVRVDKDDLELDPKNIRLIRRLMQENQARGTMKISVSRNAEDERRDDEKWASRDWKRRGRPELDRAWVFERQ